MSGSPVVGAVVKSLLPGVEMDELRAVLEELEIIDAAWEDSWAVWVAEEENELRVEGF